jgi:hypothetical protein
VDYREAADMILAVSRVMANDTIATVATPHFANVSAYFINGTNETAAPPNFGMWFTNAIQAYPDLMGPIAYVLIAFIPFGMVFVAHGSTRLLMILGLITSAFISFYVGGMWMMAGLVVIMLAIIGMLWTLFRG